MSVTAVSNANVHTAAEVPLERLEAEITELAGHLAATQARWLGLVAEYDRRQGWASWECASCAQWLAWKCGLGLNAAREHVRVARRLEALPAIRDAFSRGELTYSKVRALTRAATPDTDADLAELARATTASQLERVMRGLERALEPDKAADEAEEAHEARSLCWGRDRDGSLVIEGRLPAELGELFVKTVAAVMDALDVSAETSGEGDERPTVAERRADALVAMAETVLVSGAAPASGAERHLVHVHVDAEVLAHDAPGRCEIEDGPTIAPETARRLTCDASLVAVLRGWGGEVLDLGRRRRAPNRAQRRALKIRDGGCRFPGCTQRRWVDAHHVQHWSRGGPTDLQNLLLLCRRHHRSVHEGGWRITTDPITGELVFHRPDGGAVNPSPPAGPGRADLDGHNRRLGLDIGPQTCGSVGAGERLDYDDTVMVLCLRQLGANRRRARAAAASTSAPSG